MKKNVIFFDVETNGLQGSSVLSISAIKASFNIENNKFEKVDEYKRFYFRNEGESLNIKAISVNGLTDEEIQKRRENQKIDYPLTFLQDIDSFYNFCKDTEHFVAHNIRFDRTFIPFNLKYQFDTMLENIDIVKIYDMKFSKYKWPKLNECATFYKVPFDENELHDSMYDVLIMARVMYKMLRHEKSISRIRRFLINNKSTEMR